jgi:hypothetical protein
VAEFGGCGAGFVFYGGDNGRLVRPNQEIDPQIAPIYTDSCS